MKKILLSAFALGTLLATAQTNVSTTAENRNVVLEEFTGIHCGYCPDGHVLAQQLHDNNPNDVMLINIHVGSYATPGAGEPDFRTQWGTAIDGQAGVAGYPAGTVNRHLFSGMQQGSGTAMSRGDWATASGQVFQQSSPVNVWSEAIVDMGTNSLIVNVEVYYTGTQTVTSNSLNVAVLQNNVEGPQSGGSNYNPGAILANGNYNHQHMLRHLLTGQWGDQLDTIAQGTLITRTYTWNLPNDINGVELDPTNLEVVAFIAEGNQEVISGDYSTMSFNFPNTYDAFYSDASQTDAVCGTDASPEITFKNYGNISLTSLDIDYSINGGTVNTYNWSGNLTSGASETVTLPTVTFSAQATNTVNFSLSSPNGNTDQNTANNDGSVTFAQYAAAGQVPNGFYSGQVSVDITSDQWGSETTWELIDDNGSVVGSGGPYPQFQSSGTTVNPTEYVTVNINNCYSFVIYDSYGDGINAGYGNGSYSVSDMTGNVIASGGSGAWSEERGNFEVDATWVSVSDLENTISVYPNPVKDNLNISGEFDFVEIYDVFGKLVLSTVRNTINTTDLADGIYVVNVNTSDVIITKRITVSK
ncbi:MAG: Omp28-related outer membrane protein [Flavobacteriales bacterium]|nr:Omp28-related outer membrane protein [Flavobacteriales bacterium]